MQSEVAELNLYDILESCYYPPDQPTKAATDTAYKPNTAWQAQVGLHPRLHPADALRDRHACSGTSTACTLQPAVCFSCPHSFRQPATCMRAPCSSARSTWERPCSPEAVRAVRGPNRVVTAALQQFSAQYSTPSHRSLRRLRGGFPPRILNAPAQFGVSVSG
jgi:hypothetical protein